MRFKVFTIYATYFLLGLLQSCFHPCGNSAPTEYIFTALDNSAFAIKENQANNSGGLMLENVNPMDTIRYDVFVISLQPFFETAINHPVLSHLFNSALACEPNIIEGIITGLRVKSLVDYNDNFVEENDLNSILRIFWNNERSQITIDTFTGGDRQNYGTPVDLYLNRPPSDTIVFQYEVTMTVDEKTLIRTTSDKYVMIP